MSLDLILDHWELALLLATWSLIGVFAIKRRYDWRQRRFTQQVNFSLNSLAEAGSTGSNGPAREVARKEGRKGKRV